MMNVSL